MFWKKNHECFGVKSPLERPLLHVPNLPGVVERKRISESHNSVRVFHIYLPKQTPCKKGILKPVRSKWT